MVEVAHGAKLAEARAEVESASGLVLRGERSVFIPCGFLYLSRLCVSPSCGIPKETAVSQYTEPTWLNSEGVILFTRVTSVPLTSFLQNPLQK
jgi:hypothetical protein